MTLSTPIYRYRKSPHCSSSAHAHKDQRGIDAGLDADIKYIQQPGVGQYMPVAMVVGAGFIEKVCPKLRMIHGVGPAHGNKIAQIAQQAAKGDAAQQQRLEFLHDAQIEQHEGDDDHNQILPAAIHKEGRKAGFVPELQKGTEYVHRSLLIR